MAFVVAIELGANQSIISFSSKAKPEEVNAYCWNGISPFAPSSVLLTPDKKFAAFGHEAEDKFKELAKDGREAQWWMFRDLTALFNTEVITERKQQKYYHILEIHNKQYQIHHLKHSLTLGCLRHFIIVQDIFEQKHGMPKQAINCVFHLPVLFLAGSVYMFSF